MKSSFEEHVEKMCRGCALSFEAEFREGHKIVCSEWCVWGGRRGQEEEIFYKRAYRSKAIVQPMMRCQLW